MHATIENVVRIAAPVLAVGVILLSTPIGGNVNFVNSGLLGVGAIHLFFTAAAEIFSFRDWNYWPHWKDIMMRLGGAFALFAIIQMILPPPRSNQACNSVMARSGLQTTCHD